jgi:hypothetical protein
MDDTKEKMTEREYREKLKDAHELFDAFKLSAYKAKEI